MKQTTGAVMVVLTALLLGCSAKDESVPAPSLPFEIHRGVNVSHWLSQTEIRGDERAAYITEKDFALIAALGFDHVRLPVDEEQLWDEEGQAQPAAFELLHHAVSWSLQHGLRVIIDLHVLRSHHFNVAESRKLWDDAAAQQQFIGFWQQLSAQLEQYPIDMVAYELLNEAVSDDPQDWNKLVTRAIAEVRKLEPERVIVMGSNNWQQPGTFPDLAVPEGDPNLILSFHYYVPMPVTHYKAPWTELAAYDGPVSYPGMAVEKELYTGMSKELRAAMEQYNGYFDQSVLEAGILPAVKVAKRHNLQLYCGEFGCFPTTPVEMRQAYYRDLVGVFGKHDIAWAHWNYKADFPLVTKELEPINELLEVLLPPGA